MKKQTFDLGWEYTDMTGMMAMFAKWQPVNLPHDFSITKPRAPAIRPAVRRFCLERRGRPTASASRSRKIGAGQSREVEFEGVYMNAEVSINRQLVALHPYGYTSFIVDLTPYLKYGD